MNKPEFVYAVINSADGIWTSYFYNKDNAFEEATNIAIEQGYNEEDLYFDTPDDDSYLFSKKMTEDDIPIAAVLSYYVEDYDE